MVKFHRQSRSKILVISETLPMPDKASGDLRLFQMLALLAKQHQVDVYPSLETPNEAHYAAKLKEISVQALPTGWRSLDQALSRRVYDIALLEFWHIAEEYQEQIRRHQPWIKILIDTVDIHFLREEAEAKLGLAAPQSVGARKQRELAVYRSADAVLVVTPEDRQALEPHLPGLVSFSCPNIQPARERVGVTRGSELLFVGGFQHAPNADGLLWFVASVWPLITSRIPDAKLTVIGSRPTPEVLALGQRQGIEVVGYVPDTAPYLDRALISIAPLRYGAGMKGKVTEAMANGLPVVTTSFGAQGIHAVLGEHLLVADEPGEFADHITFLAEHPEQAARIGKSAQAHIAGICGPDVVEQRLSEAFNHLTAHGNGRKGPTLRWCLLSLIHRLKGVLRPLVKGCIRRTDLHANA